MRVRFFALSSRLARTKFLCLYRFLQRFDDWVTLSAWDRAKVYSEPELPSRYKLIERERERREESAICRLALLAGGTCNYNNKNKLRELFLCVLRARQVPKTRWAERERDRANYRERERERCRERDWESEWQTDWATDRANVRPIGTLAIRFYG